MREIIVSRQNPLVKKACALLEKKHRRSMKLFRFDGVKLFCEAVSLGLSLDSVILSDRANTACAEAVEKALNEGKIEENIIYTVSESVFEKLSEEKSPEGIVTIARNLDNISEEVAPEELSDLVRGDRILLAEALRDPGNLGTVIRSCAALGIDSLVLSWDCADIYNPKTVRAAMGGLFRLKVYILSPDTMPQSISALRQNGRGVFAAALCDDAVDIGTLKLSFGDCFVIGNEGHGLSEEVIAACDAACVIPMKAGCESLNASAAAAICIWETVKV